MATPPTKARTRLAIGSMRTAITLGTGPSNLFSRTSPSTATLIPRVPRFRATPGVGPRAESQFGEDVFEVALNRSLRQEQPLGDDTARHPRGHQAGHLQLALAQAPGAAGRFAAACTGAGLACQCEELGRRHCPSRFPSLLGDSLLQSGAGVGHRGLEPDRPGQLHWRFDLFPEL